jgi:hypothetical protein
LAAAGAAREICPPRPSLPDQPGFIFWHDAKGNTVHVLIVAMHTRTLNDLVIEARECGFRTTGTISDSEAINEIRLHLFDVVILGPGIKPDARARIKAACLDKTWQPQVIEHVGPENFCEKIKKAHPLTHENPARSDG